MTIHFIKSCISSETCVLQRFKMTTCRKVEFLHCRKGFSKRPGYSDMSKRQKTDKDSCYCTNSVHVCLSPCHLSELPYQ